MVFYIAVIIFHNQHESNHISMVFYIVVIIYDSVIISLTYCFFNISPDTLYYRHMQTLIFYYFFIFYFFEKLLKHGSKIG